MRVIVIPLEAVYLRARTILHFRRYPVPPSLHILDLQYYAGLEVQDIFENWAYPGQLSDKNREGTVHKKALHTLDKHFVVKHSF